MDVNSQLWIGTLSGLFTFDGTSFRQFLPEANDAPLPLNIAFLQFTPDGSLWVFGTHGLPVVIRGQHTKIVGKSDSDPIRVLGGPVLDRRGRLWAVLNEHRLVSLGEDDVWHSTPTPVSPEQHLTNFFIGKDGTQWLVSDDLLYRKPESGLRFEPTTTYAYGRSGLCDGVGDDLWIASSGPHAAANAPYLQHLSAKGSPLPAPMVSEPLIDVSTTSDGDLWMVSLHSNLYRLDISAPHKQDGSFQNLQSVTLETAMVGTRNRLLLSTSNGDMWIGGLGGIERFAKAQLLPLLPDMIPGDWESCANRDGSQWVLDPEDDLLFVSEGPLIHRVAANVESLFCTESGVVGSDDHGLFVPDIGSIRRLPLLPGITGYSNHYIFTGVVRDQDGDLLATVAGGGVERALWRWNGLAWTQEMLLTEFPEVYTISNTGRGELAFGLADGSVALVRQSQVIWRSVPDFGRTGPIVGFTRVKDGTIIFGTKGSALWTASGVAPIQMQRAELEVGICGVVTDSLGNLWLNGARGIVRIRASEWTRFLQDRSYHVESDNLREGDFVGPANTSLFAQRAQRDGKGHLWFSTLNGIISVHPETLPKERAPSLFIRSMHVDGEPLEAGHALPPGIGALTISYTGVDYDDPYGVTYAYRLLGYDDTWLKVATRNDAVFTHLKAGTYTFQVVARSSQGLWTEPVSADSVTVLPHFYERKSFLAGCLLAVLVAPWLASALRVRSSSNQISRMAEARADERVRIARDLHDTLLQGIQGLLLSLHVATEKIAPQDEARLSLERALARAERLVIEGRQRVKSLRVTSFDTCSLATDLSLAIEDLNSSAAITVNSIHEGKHLSLRDDISSEVFLITREALRNASRHASARTISITLYFRRSEFIMECIDDGVGMLGWLAPAAREPNAWGVQGMSERADSIGAQFALVAMPEGGVKVQLRLSSKRAYKH